MRRAILLFFILAFAAAPAADAGERDLLWRVVQTCLVNHGLTGGSFPCLDVRAENGRETGYAVLRAPLEETHIIVTPLVHTMGIEAERLRGPDAPDYFHDAWVARHYVTDDLPKKPERDDLALALNSRPGRSQDQLHIHVDCVKPEVKEALERQTASIRTDRWTRISVPAAAPHYLATALASADLAHVNLIDLAAKGLKVDDPDEMEDVTLVAIGADKVDGAPGFILLARQRRPHTRDIAHGEALLDHDCSAFR